MLLQVVCFFSVSRVVLMECFLFAEVKSGDLDDEAVFQFESIIASQC